MKRRFSSLLLAAIMCLSLFCTPVLAVDDLTYGEYDPTNGSVHVVSTDPKLVDGTTYPGVGITRPDGSLLKPAPAQTAGPNGLDFTIEDVGTLPTDAATLATYKIVILSNNSSVVTQGPLKLKDTPPTPVKPETPEAKFELTTGILSDVDSTMEYSLDNGNTWTAITGTTVDLSAEDFEVGDTILVRVKAAGGAPASNIQTITLTQAAKPTGIAAVNATDGQNNGRITRVDSTMEYKLSTADTWTAITGSSVTGLAPGTYEVRVKTAGTAFASEVVTVTITNTNTPVNPPIYPPVSPSDPGGSSSSGGGSYVDNTRYEVTVDRVSGGIITASPTNPKSGTRVTITINPDDGYKLESVTVTTAAGKNVTVTRQRDGTYSFVMPGINVKVTAVFAEKPNQPTQPNGSGFYDVASNAWYAKAVQYVVERGMMSGTASNTFSPDTKLNRAMIVQVLYNMEGTPSTTSADFKDVPTSQWYARAVYWAANNGLVSGYSDGKFGPTDNVTREQMAVILYNYAKSKGYDISASGSLSGFNDGSRVSSWAKTAMQWAVGANLLSGKGEGMLDPTGTATRAEVAQILMNFSMRIV